jgi:hypothetical protein
MSSFRELVLNIEARARALGVRLSMAKLRDAISIALVDRPYSAGMAAENAGALGAVALPPRHLEKACERYRLDAGVFAEAFAEELPQDDAVDVPRLFLDPVGLDARPPVFTVMLRDDAAPSRGNGDALCDLDLENYPPEIVALGLEKEYDRLCEDIRAEFGKSYGSPADYHAPTVLDCGAGDGRARPADGLTLDLENLSSGTPAPLYERYATQNSPQSAFVELDEDGTVTADWSGEIGNAVPSFVWHGRTLRFSVSPNVVGKRLLKYLEGDGRPLLARIHAGHEVEWDGSNQRGRLSEDAEEASAQLEADLAEIDEVPVWPVDEWLFGAQSLADAWSREPLEELARSLEEQARRDGLQLDGEVKEALLCRAKELVEEECDDELTRHVVRTLVREGEVKLLRYAEWIARAGDGADVAEAELDRDLPTTSLYIMDSGASSEEIDRGRWAAEASFEASGVSVAQAYIASLLRAEDVPYVAAHAEAWDEAERAALAEAFKGWYKHPESAVLVLG